MEEGGRGEEEGGKKEGRENHLLLLSVIETSVGLNL